MKKTLALIFAAALIFACCTVSAEKPPRRDGKENEERIIDYDTFFSDLGTVQTALSQVNEDILVLDDKLINYIAEKWKMICLDPDYRILVNGKDDPTEIPVSGKHAFVVLGFELKDGEMKDELKDRCDAAAAAARVFPDSILVCSGGATGENNPESHTEAGLMKEYLTQECGIEADRIFIDEKAMDTVGNALNTFEILKEQQIEEATIITSNYHQRRANLLYEALGEFIRETEDYSVSFIGNYSCEAESSYGAGMEERIIAPQLSDMITYLRSGLREAREMVINYGAYGEEAADRNAELLAKIQALNPANAEKWKQIMELWRSVNSGLEIHEGILPDGLPDTEELCIVALGFQLNPDGSMREELTERLKVVLASAEKYPKAVIVCTGGGTAAENEQATEAGRMAEWLITNGVNPERIIAEDGSQTTAQNAIFTLDRLEEDCPQIRQLAIVSSNYHIATGTLLFEAESILRSDDPEQRIRVVSNAAYKEPSGNLPVMFQAGALIELSGDEELAYEIYYDTYEIHELPARK